MSNCSSSFGSTQVEDQYNKALFNLIYLVMMQLSTFFRQGKIVRKFHSLITEEFDERKFCKYYLRGYQKLKELDR